jgi:hypothetical protein
VDARCAFDATCSCKVPCDANEVSFVATSQ